MDEDALHPRPRIPRPQPIQHRACAAGEIRIGSVQHDCAFKSSEKNTRRDRDAPSASAAAALTTSVSARSPTTMFTPSRSRICAAPAASRTRQVTRTSPRRTSARARSAASSVPPMKPVAPVRSCAPSHGRVVETRRWGLTHQVDGILGKRHGVGDEWIAGVFMASRGDPDLDDLPAAWVSAEQGLRR